MIQNELQILNNNQDHIQENISDLNTKMKEITNEVNELEKVY